MQRFLFASDRLPAHLDERARFSLFRDVLTAQVHASDFTTLPDRPFSVRLEGLLVGGIRVLQCNGTMSSITRDAQAVAADGNDDFWIGLNVSGAQILHSAAGRETVLARGSAALGTNGEAGTIRTGGENAWRAMAVPRPLLRELVTDVEDQLGNLVHESAALRHLRRYLGILMEDDGIDAEPPLLAHVDRTLADLMALGASRDAAQLARMRGLRAARAREVIAAIKASFADPALSPSRVGLQLDLSPRYVQDLLQETGASFSERVLELRLKKAQAMLGDRRHDRLKIADVARACGFNETAHFNRCFRRRFGAAPTEVRGHGRMV